MSAVKKAKTEERKAGIALVGAGRWSQGWHIPQLFANPKVELVALASGRAVPMLAEKYGARAFLDVDELLADEEVSKSLDGVVIATPHAVHSSIGLKCIKAGINVFMEKPMTTDVKEALELTAAANGAEDLVFMVNNTANFRESARLSREMVERGDIGDVRHAMVMFAVPLGFLFDDPAQRGWVEPSGTMLGNGLAWGQLAHTFGWLWMVSGLIPQEVFAYLGKGGKTDADVYDTASILCTNGATVSVSGVGIIPGKSKLVQNRLFGTEGMLSYCGSYEIDEGDDDEEGVEETDKCGEMGEGCPHSHRPGSASEGELKLERFDGKGNTTVSGFEFENIQKGGTGPESLNAFVDACLGLPYFKGTTADIGYLCVATIDAMYRSAKSGKSEAVVMLPTATTEAES